MTGPAGCQGEGGVMGPAPLTTDALAAFYHLYAYADGLGPGFGDALRESLDLQPQN